MKLIKKIVSIFYKFLMLIKIILISIFYKNKIYLFGTPVHGNLGDEAILLSEEKFLKENFSDMKIIEIEMSLVLKLTRFLKLLVGDSFILIHGGGFLGTIWPMGEDMFRILLKTFQNNTIIVFPQSIYFSNDAEGKKILEESKKIYALHKKLYICCRERYSFEFMKNEFKDCNALLIPDIVLYMNRIEDASNRKDTLFCIRQDREKIIYNLEQLENNLKDEYHFNIDYTDMVIPKNVYTVKERKREIIKKLEQFQNYKLVVTDRLHGMVFAFLSNTPCLVFQNKSYKVKGLYEWIKDCNYIELTDENNMIDASKKLLNIVQKKYPDKDFKEQYEPLIQLIDKSIKEEKK